MKHIIEEGTYQGYIWQSDQQQPKVYNKEAISNLVLDDELNPFVIEGQLYDEEKEISYSIKYVDGKYLIQKYNLIELEGKPSKMHCYYPNHMDGLDKDLCLQFAQYWKAEKDSLCEGMEVLQPDKLVFTGFIGKEVQS